MPRVPMPEGQMAQLQGGYQGRLQATEASDYAARQTMALGAALEGAGAQAAKLEEQAQAQADELRLSDALNQFKERQLTLQHDKDIGYTSVKGAAAFEARDGRGLQGLYDDKLAMRQDEISATLGNDRQRALFNAKAQEMRIAFGGGVKQHEKQEYVDYQKSVAEGIISTNQNRIALNWNNPEETAGAVSLIRSEAYRLAKLTGKSAEWQESQVRKSMSDAHKTAISSALDNGAADYAANYLEAHKGEMEPNDILSVRGNITKAVDAQIGMGVAQDVAGKAVAKAAPTDADRVIAITIQSESGGNPNAVSPAGARGRMQVMPETAKNPGFGIKPSDGTPEDDERVGRELIQHNVKRYAGDLGKAWAAYNAGGGWVDKAVERAGKATPGTPEADWFWQLNHDARSPANRQQTQDYVTKNLAAYNAGGGVGPRPTFADIDASLRSDPRLAGNPERLKIARQEAERQYEAQTKAIKQRDDDAVAEAMRQVQANGGRYTDLPPAVRAAIPPKEVDNVMNYAARVSKGDDTTSPLLYQRLTENPAYLKNLTEAQFFALRRELSEADFKHFSGERAKLLGVKGAGSGGAGDLNTGAINAGLADRLRQLKVDPTPKDGSDDAARLGTLRKVVNDYFARAQQEAGKKFTDAEVGQHMDALFAKNAEVRGWFSNTTVPVLGMKEGDISSTEREQIKSALKRQGISSPSDAQVLETYMRHKLTRFPQQARAEIPR